MSVAAGYNLQLFNKSSTYPDRLFFLGGVDSLRSFLADSVVPQDVASRIVDGDLTHCGAGGSSTVTSALSICNVGIRGGDIVLNPAPSSASR